jgi:hypothetical protein
MFNGTAPGAVGPMEQCLKDHGGVNPLVFGHFGEISYEFDRLLQQAAETGAEGCTLSVHFPQSMNLKPTNQ